MIDISNLILVHDSDWVKDRDWLYHYVFSGSPTPSPPDRSRILAKAAKLTNDSKWANDGEWGAVVQHHGDDGAIFIIYRLRSSDGKIRMNVLASSEEYWVKSILELR